MLEYVKWASSKKEDIAQNPHSVARKNTQDFFMNDITKFQLEMKENKKVNGGNHTRNHSRKSKKTRKNKKLRKSKKTRK